MNLATREMIRRMLAALCLLAAAPGVAQTSDPRPSAGPVTSPGRLSDSAVGEAGQRQTREPERRSRMRPMAFRGHG